MRSFLDKEKVLQTAWKSQTSYISSAARENGIYRGASRLFCLANSCAEENLFREFRFSAMEYFGKQEIKWHYGQNGKPTNHLCSSQVCCVNFLFPFADKPNALKELLSPLFPGIQKMLPMEGEFPDQFVSFEWIGRENYLKEKVHNGEKRTRGANFTSVDAAVMFERDDGSKQIVLIEWKYTESYSSAPLHVAASGTDRTAIYRWLYEREDCPLDKSLDYKFDDFFYEPFYQLMRQQFLAHEMERARELDADEVSVLHIAAGANSDFRAVTSPKLKALGNSPTEIWKNLILKPDRFTSVSTEQLFGSFPINRFPELEYWWEYVHERYSWIGRP